MLIHAENRKAMDVKGIFLFLGAVIPFLFCFAEGGNLFPWISPVTLGLFLFSALMFLFFLDMERTSESPLLPIKLLKDSIFKKSALAAAMAYVALFGLILYVPYFVQVVLKKSAVFSGMVMLPMSISMVAGGMAGGALISKTQRYRFQGTLNLLIAMAGMTILLIYGSHISIPMLIVGILLAGLGIGMNFPVINIAPQAVFPPAMLGIVISAIEFFQVMGGVISTSVSGNLLHFSLWAVLLFSILMLGCGMVAMLMLNDKAISEGFFRQHGRS
jgi:predicted MFS family arabinose efflux permease